MTNFRLPETVKPVEYRLEITPDLEQEVFTGSVEIDLELAEPTSSIVLHSLELDISSVEVLSPSRIEATHRVNPEDETITIEVPEQLPAGSATVKVVYSGKFNPKLVGIYLSKFTDDDGNEQRIAATQFEAPHARRAFPCFDEPSFKAIFKISLITSAELEAISNGRKLSSSEVAEGKTRHDFAPTMPLSTYLVAFVVGPLEVTDPINVAGIDVRVAYRAGREGLEAFAEKVARFSLEYMTDYFGIEYQGDKIDLIALPDFEMGAMENQGCITFRETALLIDESRATQPELERTADVIAHELAHMWFGNLVTMQWWHGLWLNEAFATFMELKVVDAMFSEWDRWGSFMRSRSAAFDTDITSATRPIEFQVDSPAEAEAMFDILTYEKGASLVRMLEQYVGEDEFREGLRHYMATHKFSNTETIDLWNSVDSATSLEASAMMNTWIHQPGFPTVSAQITNGSLELTQERLYHLGASGDKDDFIWAIPISYKIINGTETIVGSVLLDERSETLDLAELGTNTDPDCVVLNAGGDAFIRVAYSEDLLDACASNLEALSQIERYSLIDDAWSSVLAGKQSTTAFLNLCESFSGEESRVVWTRIIAGLHDLSELLSDAALEEFARVVSDLVRPALIKIGMTPTEGESQTTAQLRGELISTLGILGQDADIQDECQRTVSVFVRDPELVDPSIATAAIAVTARIGEEADFDQFVEQWRSANNPQDEQRYLGALAHFNDEQLRSRFHKLILDREIKNQTAPFLLRAGLASRKNRSATWDFITTNWDELADYFSDALTVRMLDGVRFIASSEEAVTETRDFVHSRNLRIGEKTIAQVFERQSAQLELTKREAAKLEALFSPR